MADILKQIINRKEVENRALALLDPDRKVLSMTAALRSRERAVIAEFKRRSPSRGDIRPMADPAVIVPGYVSAGAAALSVLTDTPFFGGSLTDLAVARMCAPDTPILRKDFVTDEAQIDQARWYGADAVLLIAAVLPPGRLARLTDYAHDLGLEVLVEVHDPAEIAAVPTGADMVGVNSRNLSTFATDTAHTAALARLLPHAAVRVAESGISSPATLDALAQAGYGAFLIGSALMESPDPAQALQDMLNP